MTDMSLRTQRLLEMWQDPVIRQKWSQRRSWGQRKDPRHLPWPKGDPRRALYKKLRRLGVNRADAIMEASK